MWKSQSSSQLEGFYLQLEDDSESCYLGIKGSTSIRQLLVRFETLRCELDNEAGNALTLHLDHPLGSSNIGFDYFLLQPGYPISDAGLDEINGKRSYALRAITQLSKIQQLRFQGTYCEESLEGTYSTTKHQQNYYLDYQIQLSSSSLWNMNYQEDYQYQNTNSNKCDTTRTKSVLVGYQQKYRQATFNTSFTASQENNKGEASTTEQSLFSCTLPVTKFNLTPSLRWQQDKSEKLAEARITADLGWNPDLNRSRLALFHQITNKAEGTSPETNKTGCEATLYFKTGSHSTFTLTYNNSFWENDQSNSSDKTLALEWKLLF